LLLMAATRDTRHVFYATVGELHFVIQYRLLWNVTGAIASVVGLEHEEVTESGD